MTARPTGGRPARLVVDPVRCDGVGICAYVAARLVDLDRWGYPVLPTRALDRREQQAARAAAAACPRRALLLRPVGDAQTSGEPPVMPRS